MLNFFIHEKTVITIIIINALALFLDAFPSVHAKTYNLLYLVDYCCVIYFILEIFIKIRLSTFKLFWENGWNRFDFIIVLASTPVLLTPIIDLRSFSVILILRLSRLLRMMKVLRFIPNSEKLAEGIGRALKASVGVFVALFFLNLLLATGATMLFSTAAPEYFGNPLTSLYTLFKVFTVEGWYEIPDMLASQNHSMYWIMLVRGYFILSVIVGGILGLSLANAVFVDEMTIDNTQKAEEMLAGLKEDIQELRKEIQSLKP